MNELYPSLFEIRYFMETAKTLNISRAAERLRIQQSSLSQAIRRLETSVGAPLFLRNKSGVQLTKAGKRFLAYSRELIEHWEGARNSVMKSENELSGQYRFGAAGSLATGIFPIFVPRLLDDHPQLDFEFVHDSSRKITDGVVNFEIDFGFVIEPPQHPDLVIRPLWSTMVGCWIKDDRALLEKFEQGESNLVCTPGLFNTEEYQKYFKRKKVRFRRTLFTTSVELILTLTQAGAGVGILPEWAMRVSSGSRLRYLDHLLKRPSNLFLVYRKDSQGSPAARTLARRIEELCQKTLEELQGWKPSGAESGG